MPRQFITEVDLQVVRLSSEIMFLTQLVAEQTKEIDRLTIEKTLLREELKAKGEKTNGH